MSGTARELMLERTNRNFYEPLWDESQLIVPSASIPGRWSNRCCARTRVAWKSRPACVHVCRWQERSFVDVSERAVARLREAGACAEIGSILDLPLANDTFDLVCAMDVIEHVEDDVGALSELTRVLAPHGTLLISVPLHQSHWTAFDDFVGHCRRYEPATLTSLLAQFGLRVESSAVYGMQPRSSRLLDLGLWYLVNQRERAMWWYNRVFMPLAIRFQKPLKLVEGLIADENVDEVLVVCRTCLTA